MDNKDGQYRYTPMQLHDFEVTKKTSVTRLLTLIRQEFPDQDPAALSPEDILHLMETGDEVDPDMQTLRQFVIGRNLQDAIEALGPQVHLLFLDNIVPDDEAEEELGGEERLQINYDLADTANRVFTALNSTPNPEVLRNMRPLVIETPMHDALRTFDGRTTAEITMKEVLRLLITTRATDYRLEMQRAEQLKGYEHMTVDLFADQFKITENPTSPTAGIPARLHATIAYLFECSKRKRRDCPTLEALRNHTREVFEDRTFQTPVTAREALEFMRKHTRIESKYPMLFGISGMMLATRSVDKLVEFASKKIEEEGEAGDFVRDLHAIGILLQTEFECAKGDPETGDLPGTDKEPKDPNEPSPLAGDSVPGLLDQTVTGPIQPPKIPKEALEPEASAEEADDDKSQEEPLTGWFNTEAWKHWWRNRGKNNE